MVVLKVRVDEHAHYNGIKFGACLGRCELCLKHLKTHVTARSSVDQNQKKLGSLRHMKKYLYRFKSLQPFHVCLTIVLGIIKMLDIQLLFMKILKNMSFKFIICNLQDELCTSEGAENTYCLHCVPLTGVLMFCML